MIKYEFLIERYEKEDGLRKAVLQHLIDRYHDYTDIEDCIREILTYGCVSGCVSSLIYYKDTLAFYEQHRNEISLAVYDLCLECGTFDMNEVFPEWDKQDPLCVEVHNRNLLAWFGFEYALYRLAFEWEVTF